MSIDFDEYGYQKVSHDEYFHFDCACCGDCCRNVKTSVMVESLDLYRLARFFDMEMSEVMLRYTDTAYLAWGFPVLMLKTKQHLDTCILLKSSRCSVHNGGAKPRTCRTYPLGVGPDDEKPGKWLSLIVSKKKHHFTGKPRLISDWLDENLTPKDRAFVAADYINAGELAKIIRKIGRHHKKQVIKLNLLYKYVLYDISEDFQPQYNHNMEQLKKQLEWLGGM
jgi:Fe-S-cluster containining protein